MHVHSQLWSARLNGRRRADRSVHAESNEHLTARTSNAPCGHRQLPMRRHLLDQTREHLTCDNTIELQLISNNRPGPNSMKLVTPLSKHSTMLLQTSRSASTSTAITTNTTSILLPSDGRCDLLHQQPPDLIDVARLLATKRKQLITHNRTQDNTPVLQ